MQLEQYTESRNQTYITVEFSKLFIFSCKLAQMALNTYYCKLYVYKLYLKNIEKLYL